MERFRLVDPTFGTQAEKLALPAFVFGIDEISVPGPESALEIARVRLAFVEETLGSSVSVVSDVRPAETFVTVPHRREQFDATDLTVTQLGRLLPSVAPTSFLSGTADVPLTEQATVLAESIGLCVGVGPSARRIGDVTASWILPAVVAKKNVPVTAKDVDASSVVVLFTAAERVGFESVDHAIAWAQRSDCASVVKFPALQAAAWRAGARDPVIDAALAACAALGRDVFCVDVTGRPLVEWAAFVAGIVSDPSAECASLAASLPIAVFSRSTTGPRETFYAIDARRSPDSIEEAVAIGPTGFSDLLWSNPEIASYVSKFSDETASLRRARTRGKNLGALKGSGVGRAALLVGNGVSRSSFSVAKAAEALGDPVVFAFNRGWKDVPGAEFVVWADEEMTPVCSRFSGKKATYATFERALGRLENRGETFFFTGSSHPGVERFESSDGDDVWEATSGGIGIQIAASMGCDPIVLLGFDCARLSESLDGVPRINATWEGKPGDAVVFSEKTHTPSSGTVVSNRRLASHARALSELASTLVARGVEVSRIGHAGLLRDVPVDEKLTRACRIRPRGVLFVRGGGGVGDALQFTPVVREWKERYPDDVVSVLSAHPSVFENSPRVDAVVPPAALLSKDGRVDPDTLSAHELVIRLDWAISRRVDGSLRDIRETQACVDSYSEAAGLPIDESRAERYVHELFPTREDVAAVDALRLPEEFVVLCANGRSRAFGWSAATWSRVAKELSSIAPVVAVGTSCFSDGRDRDFRVGGTLDVVDKTANVRQLFEIVKRSEGIVTWDSGPLHVAACCPTVPVFAVFVNAVITGSDNVARRAPRANPLGYVEVVSKERVPGMEKFDCESVARAAAKTLSGEPVRFSAWWADPAIL